MLCPLGRRVKRVNRIKARKAGAREDEKGQCRDELWQKNGKHDCAHNGALFYGVHGIDLCGIPERTLIKRCIATIQSAQGMRTQFLPTQFPTDFDQE